jgi:hypothetical protein
MEQFVTYLLRAENVLIMLAVSVSISVVHRLFAQHLERNPVWIRLLPVLPIMMCSVAVWLPDLVIGGAYEKILLGVVLGAFSGHAHKLIRQTVFGNDKRIRDHPTRL